ncbi:MAG: hypothetical protein ABSF45_21550 [Terriglobia bacterium]|jgi:hypothetical protein
MSNGLLVLLSASNFHKPSLILKAASLHPTPARNLRAMRRGRSTKGKASATSFWARIKEARDKANPNCLIWLSVNDLSKPCIQDSRLLRETDWVMNESPDPRLYEIGRRMVGTGTRMIQNLVGWTNHDARNFLADPHNRGLNSYGFAEPGENSLPLPIDEYLRKPVDAFKGGGPPLGE